MAKDINLLPKLVDAEIKRSEYQRVGSRVSIGLIGLVLFLALGLFVWSLVVDNSNKQVNAEIASHEKSITDNLDKEIKIRALNAKMTAIKPLLQTPNNMSVIITQLTGLSRGVNGLDPTEITVDQNKVIYSARVMGSDALQVFIATLLDPAKGGQNFSHIVLTSLVRSQGENEYRFSLGLLYTPTKGANGASQ